MRTTRNTGSPVAFRRPCPSNISLPFLKYVAIFTMVGTLAGCSRGRVTRAHLDSLSVHWELLGNRFGGIHSSSAAFTFYNQGDSELTGKGWKIYFNQTTLAPDTTVFTGLGSVEYINGDFYRFVPGPEFSISPGDSLTMVYSYHGNLLKESDAPAGPYFVLNENKKDEWIAPVRNYELRPFRDYEKIYGDTAFMNTIPTARSRYEKNSKLSELDLTPANRITPTPYLSIDGKGAFDVAEGTVVYFEEALENEAEFIVGSFERHFGIRLERRRGRGGPGNISIMTAPLTVNGISGESYRLRIHSQEGIQVTGNDPAGVFYGIQSLLSLVPAASFGGILTSIQIPETVIEDAPRFSYRGFLLDVSRNFHTKESVLKLIDLLALYKVNLLNLRLTEDEAWRLEIEGLPELTQLGSRRGHTLDDSRWLPPSFGSGPFPDEEGNLGSGYYTREDFKEILSHAASRHIRVVPEICFPSHARAAIKSMEARYRNYMEQGDMQAAEEFRLVDPDDRSVYSSAQRYTDNIVCVARESAYHFYETVILDIRKMYEEAGLKLALFNTGGDEVPVGAWAGSPLCQELMKNHPEIENPRHLHAYFLERILDLFAKYDLTVTGWEEAVLNKDNEGNISINGDLTGKNIMPLVWDNTGSNMDLGYRIANAGYPIILCNVTNLYFDLAYTTDPREPGLYWGGYQDAMDPYVLVPFDVQKSTIYDNFGRFRPEPGIPEGMEMLRPENRKNIKGIQAQLWSETVKGQEMMEYYLLPKLFAFSEKAWSTAPGWESETDASTRTVKIQSGWNVLANRIGQYEFVRLEKMFGGSNFRIPAPGAIVKDGMLHANTAFPGLLIRYTTDGSDPGLNAPVYEGPVNVSGTTKLRAFTPGGKAGWVTGVD